MAVTATAAAPGQRSATLTVALPAGGWSNSAATIGLGGRVAGSALAFDNASTTLASTTTPIAPTTSTILSGIAPRGMALDGAGNAFTLDFNTGHIVESVGGSSATVATIIPADPFSMAIDGAGNLFALVSNAGTAQIEEFPVLSAGSPSTYGTPSVVGYMPVSGTASPQALAVDQAGNLYVADHQSGSNSAIYRISLAGNASQSQMTVATGLNNPVALAVDGSGNIYAADQAAGAVLEFIPSGATASYTQQTVLASVNPAGLAADAAGNIYVQDLGSASVIEVPAVRPGAEPVVLSGLTTPAGIAVDGKGNVYSADTHNSGVTEVVRNAVSFDFGTSESTVFAGTLTNVGTSDASGQDSSTNTTNFAVLAGVTNGCSLTNNVLGPVAAGQACTLTAQLTGSGSSSVTDAITFLPAGSTLGSLTLSGTLQGVAIATTTTISSPTPASPVYSDSGTEATFTVTVTPATGSIGSSSTVNVQVDAQPAAGYPLTASGSAGVATVTIAGLTAGNHTITATFPTGSFTGSSASTQFTIAPVTTAIAWTPAATTEQVSQAIGVGALNATATPAVPGTFAYTATPAGGSPMSIDAASYLGIGTYALSVTFTPNDAVDYSVSTAQVATFTVTKGDATAAVGASTNVVAADGTGNFTSLSDALAALPTTGGTIYIKPGTYT